MCNNFEACGAPPTIENGYSIVSSSGEIVNQNENVTYYCNEPYTMVDDTLTTLECVNGDFKPSFAEANIVCKLGLNLNILYVKQVKHTQILIYKRD